MGLTHRNNRYRMRTPIFSQVKMSPQNGGFRRAFLVVPDSYGREFRAVARSVIVFLSSKVYKQILNW